jgi:hypothetical protein
MFECGLVEAICSARRRQHLRNDHPENSMTNSVW